jgi:hypothetical protein
MFPLVVTFNLEAADWSLSVWNLSEKSAVCLVCYLWLGPSVQDHRVFWYVLWLFTLDFMFWFLNSVMMHWALTQALCCLPPLFISSAFVISKWQDVASTAGWLSEYEKAWLVYNEVAKIMRRTVRISLEHLWNWNFWDQIMKKHLALQDAFKNQKPFI